MTQPLQLPIYFVSKIYLIQSSVGPLFELTRYAQGRVVSPNKWQTRIFIQVCLLRLESKELPITHQRLPILSPVHYLPLAIGKGKHEPATTARG